jgi:hypothetical protein
MDGSKPNLLQSNLYIWSRWRVSLVTMVVIKVVHRCPGRANCILKHICASFSKVHWNRIECSLKDCWPGIVNNQVGNNVMECSTKHLIALSTRLVRVCQYGYCHVSFKRFCVGLAWCTRINRWHIDSCEYIPFLKFIWCLHPILPYIWWIHVFMTHIPKLELDFIASFQRDTAYLCLLWWRDKQRSR